ncbi:SCO family protein [Flavobacterium sp. DGU11]|uniref:SCO family protein n=1 Tax=Flavobacterium arundinis TaxID=3139143 RepID=A0ABU9HWD5_9FLAO
MKKIFLLSIIATVAISCFKEEEHLPYLGNPVEKEGKLQYPKIADFSFTDQDSAIINNATFEGKIYVADFIFLSCPTICPKMTVEMLKVYEKYRDNSEIGFLSHTIDPLHDTIPRLKAYAENLGVDNNWHFVTGNKDSIYSLAVKSYFTTAYPDDKEPGGYVHSGALLLVDKNRYIRGVYDGTNPVETQRLISDIEKLLQEPESK